MSTKQVASDWQIGIRFLFVSLLVVGGFYPGLMSGYAKFFFPSESTGSQLLKEGKVVGSRFFAQEYASDGLFLARPSAGNYNSLPSAASQNFRTSAVQKAFVEDRRILLQKRGIDDRICEELLYTSGSGLDPHITYDCAKEQARVLSKTPETLERFEELLLRHTVEVKWHLFGRKVVNVTDLNYDLIIGGL